MSQSSDSLALTADDVRENTLLRLVFRRLIPLIVLMQFISQTDRANLAILAEPIDKSLGLTATAFGFAAGMFFWGYVVFEVPSNLALLKYGSRKWLARIVISWGMVTGLTSLAQNEVQFAILRFLLGACEAGLSPGILLFISIWFSKRKQTKPLAYFQLAVPLAFTFGSILTSGLLHVFTNISPLSAWRWVFVAEGTVTVIIGVLILIALPSNPREAKWLSDDDAEFLVARREAERQSLGDVHEHLSEWQRVGLALKNAKTWYLSFTYFMILTGFWAITFFLPQIIAATFGTSTVNSGLLSAIPWSFVFIAILLVERFARKTQHRNRVLFGLLAAAGVGMLIAAFVGSPVISLIGLTLALCGVQSAAPLFYRLQTTLFTGVMAAVLLAVVNSIGNFGGFVGPFIFGFSKDQFGSNTVGITIMSGFLFIAAILALASTKVLGVAVDENAPAPHTDDRPAAKSRT
ncbi:MFS transporter [Rhodococcus sp. 1R11]|uniref:MFS transporter n=1 Tax=Rhodococcus sp. 1R11 TaxID=2559614 RepID=UPI001430C712|nr:MFS transporter [Rhodococcus sp. 1R11]